MIPTADEDHSGRSLLLEVALQTEVLVPGPQHARIGRSVRQVTDHATLTGCLVFKNVRAALLDVAAGAGFVQAGQGGTAVTHDRTAVRIVAVGAGHLAGE